MVRIGLLVLLGMTLLGVGSASSSPVKGHYRESMTRGKERTRLSPNSTFTFRETFRGNERACVMVEGDHDPVMNLTITVRDAKGNIVAEDKAGGDFIAAIWYPPRTQEYQISISSDGKIENLLDVVVK